MVSTSAVVHVSDAEARNITQRVVDALRNLRFGSIELTVHDGRVVQIERREKLRFDVKSPSR